MKTPTAFIPDNGIVEKYHKTMLNEFHRIAFRKKIYATIGELQGGSIMPTDPRRLSRSPL